MRVKALHCSVNIFAIFHIQVLRSQAPHHGIKVLLNCGIRLWLCRTIGWNFLRQCTISYYVSEVNLEVNTNYPSTFPESTVSQTKWIDRDHTTIFNIRFPKEGSSTWDSLRNVILSWFIWICRALHYLALNYVSIHNSVKYCISCGVFISTLNPEGWAITSPSYIYYMGILYYPHEFDKC